MRRTILFSVYMIVATIVATCTIAEVGLRILGYQPLTLDSTVWEHHDTRGWSHRAGANEEFHRLGFRQHIQINQRGLREREIPYENSDGRQRILVLGDSGTVGFEVPPEDVFTRVAEEALKERGYDVEIINAGCRGWGTDQILLYLREEGIKYNPDVVLYKWSINDISNNMTIHKFFRAFGKGYFQLTENGGLELKGVPVPRFSYMTSLRLNEQGDVEEEQVSLFMKARLGLRDLVAGRSALGAALLHAMDEMPALLNLVRKIGTSGTPAERASLGKRRINNKEFEETYSYRLTHALVTEMLSISNKIGAEFRMIGHLTSIYPAKIVRDLELEDLGEYAVYKNSIPEIEKVTIPFDPHWNSLGHRFYGLALAEVLVRRGLVTKSGIEGLTEWRQEKP